jgi:hypothetical protein
MRGTLLSVLLTLTVSSTAFAQIREPRWLVNATITTTNAVFGGSTCHHLGAGTLMVMTEEVGTVSGTDYLIPGFLIRRDGENGENVAKSVQTLGTRSEAIVTTDEGTYCIVLLTPAQTNVIHLMRVEARHYPAG